MGQAASRPIPLRSPSPHRDSRGRPRFGGGALFARVRPQRRRPKPTPASPSRPPSPATPPRRRLTAPPAPATATTATPSASDPRSRIDTLLRPAKRARGAAAGSHRGSFAGPVRRGGSAGRLMRSGTSCPRISLPQLTSASTRPSSSPTEPRVPSATTSRTPPSPAAWSLSAEHENSQG